MKPQPIDALWREVLRLMEVPRAPGLFVLGSFARRVTIYSQQVRALNLVDGLCGMGYLRPSSRVAVVGAGFGGITAAAALAQIGVHVSLFDAESVPMHLQINSAKRYLHPHIYDWPLKSINDDKANLPVLTWQADDANEVSKRVKESWEAICNEAEDGKIQERFGVPIASVVRQGKLWNIRVDGSNDPEPYDVVILAVGFGVESVDLYSYPYWTDLWLDDAKFHKRTWLVSGAGDGALTDVMRLCVRNCDHGETLAGIIKAVTETAGPFLEELQQRVQSDIVGTQLFEGLDVASILQAIQGDQRLYLRENAVVLNASKKSVFGRPEIPASDDGPAQPEVKPRASVLNRLVTWIMWKAGKVILAPGIIANDPDDPKKQGLSGVRGNLTVKISRNGQKDEVIKCDEVLLRHGPLPVLGKKSQRPKLLDRQGTRDLERLKRDWNNLYSKGETDPTLSTNWSKNAFATDRLGPSFVSVPGILLYSSDAMQHQNELDSLGNAVDAVVKGKAIRAQLTEATGHRYPESARVAQMSAQDALQDPRTLSRTLRCLCDAPVLIIDVTEDSPALMFLLGIRSVVRRGVTLAFRVGELNAQVWQKMAFNLRELRIVTVLDRTSLAGFERPLKIALEEGLRRYARRPFQYMDLPGFEALRNLGPDSDDHSPRKPDDEVLVLCPFDPNYEQLCWPEIQRTLRDHYADEDDDGPARRVIDVESPEVIGRRLFESIRRDEVCVVDTTLEKPNVFFELGVRTGAHEKGARLIRCVDLHDLPPTDTINVTKLLGVREYRVKEPKEPTLADALALEVDSWPGGDVSSGYAYEVIRRCIFARQESGGMAVLDLLWQTVECVTGKDRQRQASYPILYADNADVRSQTERFAFDALLAYVLLSASLDKTSRDESRRSIAFADLKYLLKDLDCDQKEADYLSNFIDHVEDDKWIPNRSEK